ncbi:MAG: PstS family phosphate ABC transporter substrate-binding protein [Pseudomonadota bacterium]
MLKKAVLVSAAVTALMSGNALADSARDYVSIVGSSTVYPFATVVAEQFGKTTQYKTPKIESTGSGGGLKLFCAGVGVEHPDITNASRAIKKSEYERCQSNGVEDIVEIKVGYDGIAMANSKQAPQFELSRKEIFLALAKQVPGKDGKLIDNPYKTWKQVNPALPNVKIEVLGPPPTSGTRDAFVELAMEAGAKSYADLKALRGAKGDDVKGYMKKLGIPMSAYNKKGKSVFKAVAHAIREDGAYVEAGENDNLIIQKLDSNPDALGIFGYSFLDQNADKVQGSKIEGNLPTFEAISSGDYPVSRSLFFYVKKAHVGVIPGMHEYIKEFTSEKAYGEEGYLTDKGLIPMPRKERKAFTNAARELKPMSM